MPKSRQRWAYAIGENLSTCNMQDELQAIHASEVGVIVYRNGEVSNRYSDGVVGVSPGDHDGAAAEDELYHPDVGRLTDCWRDVIVDMTPGPNYGAFLSYYGKGATTDAERLACDTLEDFTVNHMGDD